MMAYYYPQYSGFPAQAGSRLSVGYFQQDQKPLPVLVPPNNYTTAIYANPSSGSNGQNSNPTSNSNSISSKSSSSCISPTTAGVPLQHLFNAYSNGYNTAYDQAASGNSNGMSASINGMVKESIQPMMNSFLQPPGHQMSQLLVQNSHQIYGSNQPQHQQQHQALSPNTKNSSIDFLLLVSYTLLPLLKHKRRNSGKNSKLKTIDDPNQIFPCTKCDKVFQKPYNLKLHMKTHSTDKPFNCSYCDRKFARLHDKKRHEALHGGVKNFRCEGYLKDGVTRWGCGKKFARSDALLRHFRTETGWLCIKPLMDEAKEGDAPQNTFLHNHQLHNLSMPLQPSPDAFQETLGSAGLNTNSNGQVIAVTNGPMLATFNPQVRPHQVPQQLGIAGYEQELEENTKLIRKLIQKY